MLFLGYRGQVTGAEYLDEKQAADTKKQRNKKNQEYRLASPAIITYIHYFLRSNKT